MLRKLLSRALFAIALALALGNTPTALADELCALVPSSYATAKQTYPDAAAALTELEKHSIATWYSDRNDDYAATLHQLVSTCSESSRLSIVVYGIPNKDCEAGYSSSGGKVKTAADYLKFIADLSVTVGNRKVLYVLEPDAVGLLAKTGGCGEAAGYRENLKAAIKTLSANPNADIYLDIGYWTLQYSESLSRVAAVVQELASAGAIKGITINSSNYRSNAELSALCSAFQLVMGSTAYRCVVDTSRNYNEPTSNEWCNVKTAGIGNPPTSNTGFRNLDYFLWIKPPGESDGECNGGSHTSESLRGPAAGLFFKQAFALLWNQGYFVKELEMPTIGGSGAIPTPAPTTTTPVTPTPTPTSPIQQYTTSAPTTESPITITPALSTPAPTTESPITITPALSTPAPTASTSGSTDLPTDSSTTPTTNSPIPMATPTPTPCVYKMAGNGDANQQVVSPPTQPVPATTSTSKMTASPEDTARVTPSPTLPLPVATPLSSTPTSSEPGSDSEATDADAASGATKLPTPAPTTTRRGGVGEVATEHEGSSGDSIKQVTTETSSSSTGTTAGIFAVFVVVGLVAAIAAYMNAQAKKKELEEPKASPALPATNRACEPQASYLSAL